mgnify:FL=1|jgi:hypothetical protein|tara:strand:+ start:2291 stop:2773 length:483 start_codon:yes stop_codon:yes gene_type:complete
MKKVIILFTISIILSSCEPDDICLTTIPDTPKLIIVFFDATNGLKKEVQDLKIKGSNSDEAYLLKTTDSISLPLKNIDKTTSYYFIKEAKENIDDSGNKDLVLINYQYNHIYINRACGYKSNYNIDQIIIENDNINWIIKSEIIESSVIDENTIHVKIFH